MKPTVKLRSEGPELDARMHRKPGKLRLKTITVVVQRRCGLCDESYSNQLKHLSQCKGLGGLAP